jgi:hypothetical protein
MNISVFVAGVHYMGGIIGSVFVILYLGCALCSLYEETFLFVLYNEGGKYKRFIL